MNILYDQSDRKQQYLLTSSIGKIVKQICETPGESQQ